MSELSKKFKIYKPATREPYFELFVEGDWNDGDYVTRTSKISVKGFESDEYMLYFISYLAYNGSHFRDSDEYWELFEEAEDEYTFIPFGGEDGIHSVTEVKLTYHENGTVMNVQIPDWDSLFKNSAEAKAKVLKAAEEATVKA